MTAPDPRLGEIEGRLSKATPGPWEEYDANEGEWPPRHMWCVANDAFHNPPANEDAPWIAVEVHTGVKEDAEFIAAAPADVAYLLTELRKAQDALGRVDAEVEHIEALASDASYDRSEEVMETYLEAAQRIRAAVAAATGSES